MDVTSTTLGMGQPAAATQREKLSAAAKQFEAIFLREMLSAARKSDFGGEKLFDSQAIQTFRQMQDEHFADVASQSGVLGFASIIEAQLARFVPEAAEATDSAG
jgi:peptidoglycan hydrolase FlgJ